MRKETDLLYVTIKRHRVACLMKSFLNQSRYHYFEKYHTSFLDVDFIDDINSLENNFDLIMEELSQLRFEELDIIERRHCDIMAQAGMNTDTPPFDKSVNGKLRSLEDQQMQHFLNAAWDKGNQAVRQVVIDYIDGRVDIKFDLTKSDNNAEISYENGMSVYHLPADFKDYTQKNYTEAHIVEQAIGVLSDLETMDSDFSINNKALVE